MRSIALILVTGALLLAASTSPSQGAVITWTGATGNRSWHTPENWNPIRVPGAGDDVVIPDVSGPPDVNYSVGSTSIHTLECHKILRVLAGHLQVTSTCNLPCTFVLDTYGTLDIRGSTTFAGEFDWHGGTLTGMGTATMNAGVVWYITGSVHLGAPFVNKGCCYCSGDSLELNTTFQNYDHAGISFESGTTVYTGTHGTFQNQPGSLIDVACPADTASLRQITVVNAGEWQIGAGMLALGDFTNSERIFINSNPTWNAVCDCNGAAVFNSGTIFPNTGPLRLSGGTLTLNADVSIPNLEIRNGELTGSGALTLGLLDWTGGTMSGSGTTTVGAGANWYMNGANLNLNRTLQNDGNCTWGGGVLNLGAMFLNRSGGSFQSSGGGTHQITRSSSLYSFENQAGATFRCSSSTTCTSTTLTNAGTIDLDATAELSLDSTTMTSSGTIMGTGVLSLTNSAEAHIAAGSSFRSSLACFNSSFYVVAGADFAPSQFVSLRNCLLQLDCDATIPSLTLLGGTLTGSGAVTAQGLSWQGGTMSGTGTTTIPASTDWEIDGGFDCQLSRTLYNDGTCSWQEGGGGHLYIDGTLANRSGGRFRALVDQTMGYTSTPGTFDNQAGATFEKGGSTGTTTVNHITFNNAGTISVQSGILTLTGQFPNAQGYDLLSGTYDIQGIFRYQGARINRNYATIILDGAGSAIQNTSGQDALYNLFEENRGSFTVTNGRSLTSYVLRNYGQVYITAGGVWIANHDSRQDAGLIRLDSGTLTVVPGMGWLDINSGVLAGTGVINAEVHNSATLSPGASPGAIHITWRYLQRPTGILVAEVGGAGPGTGYDVVTVDHQAGLDGTLQPSVINGFIPEDGAVLDVLTASSISGAFTNTGLPYDYPGGCLSGQQLSDRYRLTGHTLTITQQPQSQTVSVGDPAVVTVVVDRNATFQWRKNGQPIQGATNDTLVIAHAQYGDAGNYDVICTYSCVDLQSDSATLTVLDLTPPQVLLTSPNGGEVWEAGSVHDITWSASDNVGVTAIDLACSMDGGQTYPMVIASTLPNSGLFPWIVPGTLSVTARVRATAHDAVGQVASDASDGNFEIHGSGSGVAGCLLGVDNDPGIYPNPSAGSQVRILYRLERAGRVEAEIYDPAGRLVRRLESGLHPAGVYALDWDRKDERGTTVAAGAYLVRVSRGEAGTVTKRLVMIR